MKSEIMATADFKRAWRQLTPQMRKIVSNKIGLLTMNPGHPSLHVHRLWRARSDIRTCYITNTARLVFEVKEGILYLWALGGHSVVDKVDRRSFSPHACFLPLDVA